MLNIVSSKARGETSMSAKNGSIKLVAGNSNPALAREIARGLDLQLTKAVVRRFADMEIFVEIQENVRGSDAFILQSTSYPANDHLMELLIITDALRLSGEEPAGKVGRDAWSAADDLVLRRIAQAGFAGLNAMVNGTAPADEPPPAAAPALRGPAVAAADQASPAPDAFNVSALSYSSR